MLDDLEFQKHLDEEWENVISEKKNLWDKHNLRIWALGQSHMDIAWLWRMYQIINKSRITHGKAAWHVKRLPNFSFTYSQPVILDWLRQEEPEMFEKIKEAVETGRFELQGGTYVETDGKIPMGESWCRSRLYGQRWYLKHFNKIAEIEWLPDSFGYNNNIPQFASKSGARYFYTQKITGNFPPDEFPFAHFIWKSPDGSELICYSNNFRFRPLERWHLFGHTRRILKPGEKLECNYFDEDPKSSDKLDDNSVYPEVCLVYGTGDGGHGPTSPEVHQMRYYIRKKYIHGFTTAIDYFKKYEEIKERLPVWNKAELFYNLHRGTLTTQGLVKRMNRYFEWTLTGLETMFAIVDFIQCDITETTEDSEASQDFKDSEQPNTHEILHWLWKDTLLLQFHDILPGSSIPEVYDDCYDIWIDNLEKIKNIKAKLFNKVMSLQKPDSERNTSMDYAATLINPNSYCGKTFVEIDIDKVEDLDLVRNSKTIAVTEEDGTICLAQFIDGRTYDECLLNTTPSILYCGKVDPWSAKSVALTFTGGELKDQTTSFLHENDRNYIFESDHSKIAISKVTGLITEYIDKDLDVNVISKPSNRIEVFRDWFPTEPAWNIGAGYRHMPFTKNDDEIRLKDVRITEQGPVRWCIEVVHVLPESQSEIIQRIFLYSELRGIYFEVYINWKQKDAIVKNHFSFATKSAQIIAEGPYTTEIMTADPDKKFHLEKQRWECCGHTWVAFPNQDNSWGVAVINDSKYGFDVIKDTIGMTLVRGPEYPNPSGYPVEERKKFNKEGPPTHTDQEEHIIQYAIVPFSTKWQYSGFQKYAHYFNRRIISRITNGIENPIISKSDLMGIKVSPSNLEFVSGKKFEEFPERSNEIIIRITENGRRKTQGGIIFPEKLKINDIDFVDLLERPWNERKVTIERNKDGYVKSVSCIWGPHEILSLKLIK
ncbi:MAG: hypothetical protein GF364_09875 [Candidatus Lokiarchaeota archaeon]|nr:hypothetical protein [Candidatus Lokiarchaeota archaeon]